MASYFLKSGNTYTVSSKEAMDLHEQLPAGNYVVKQNPLTKQFYLEQIDSFEIKGKLYGNTTRHADRILNTFKDRGASTGVMLTGEKGSGKTLLTKQISINAALEDIPTIVINSPWHGDPFNSFMQNINQPCVILFDEFVPKEEGKGLNLKEKSLAFRLVFQAADRSLTDADLEPLLKGMIDSAQRALGARLR